METVVETPTATSEAESYAEHKAARAAEKEPPKAGEANAVRAVDATASKEPPAKTEGTAKEPAENGQGKPDRPKRDRTAEAKITELTQEARTAREERDRLKAELEEARKPKAAAEQPKPASKPEEDPKPKLRDFVTKLTATETYEDAVERHADAIADWRDRQRQKTDTATAREREASGVRETVTRKMADARTKYDDFDTVTAGDAKAGTGLILTPPMQQFVVEHAAGMDVAYHLGKHPEDVKRIAALSPALQIAEMAFIARGHEAPQEKSKPKASAAPPPPKTIGGQAAVRAKNTAEAGSYAEHKRLRSAR